MLPTEPSPPEPGRVLVKVCGLTRLDEAVACAGAGADWIGLNFHPDSPRHVTPAVAAEIARSLPASARPVGLFVDRPAAEVLEVAHRVGLTAVQLHGHEPPEAVVALAAAGLEVIRAYRLADAGSVDAMRADLLRAEQLGGPPFAVLVDAHVPGLAGGTGRAIDPALLAMLPPLPRLILAGGLTPENVAERVGQVRPWMVDTASGVESAPGRKDPARVAAFVRAARNPTPADA